MTEKRAILAGNERLAKAASDLFDLIEEELAEKGATIRTIAIAAYHSEASNVLFVGCSCATCQAELHHAVRKACNGRKPEFVFSVVKAAVH